MKKLTAQDMKRAVSYVNNGNVVVNLYDLSDEDFLSCDFGRDLKMGNIRVADVVFELMKIHRINIPINVFHDAIDNTVGALLESVNSHLSK